ncbi:hypothetical protein D9758_012335 [Tetrapyrgos nigripes]|uniref:Cytochrome P450 n=1 Tax=Tetrapyrgos nigripes TaxID=182062 RepID=A0A8H5CN17_9AGAR|nr:hypothetical protein D9758_012335 [Tetrapyrgos nigripes]
MLSLSDFTTPILIVTVSYGACILAVRVYHRLFPPLRFLRGPANSNLLFGNFRELADDPTASLHEKWAAEYGSAYRMHGILNSSVLVLQDAKGMHHLLSHTEDIYQRPESARWNLSRLLGSGVLVTEGEKHRMQRRVMNPAFGPIQVRALTDIFVDKSLELRDYWLKEIQSSDSKTPVIVGAGLSKMTLDVIGLAGFNYEFKALTSDGDELSRAFSSIFGGNQRNFLDLLRIQFAFLRKLPIPANPRIRHAREIMDRIGKQLVTDAKKLAELPEEKDTKSRDLLTLLVRSNMNTSIPEHQRMKDEDVLARHETTSTSTSWAIWVLTQHKDVQAKLREELLTVATDNPSMEELNALPYLDSFVREVLRMCAPIMWVFRTAIKDDVMPLKDPIVDVNGKMHTELHIRKGQQIKLSILAMNKDKKVWGDDAAEFKPERWGKEPEAAHNIPGVWSHLMTFIGGPRACIGWRFSVVEMKALLFTLVRAFEFDLAVPKEEIIFKKGVMAPLARPAAKNLPGHQLPVVLTPVKKDN